MRKYIGTSTSSKNTKNTIASSAMNTPITDASSSNIQNVNDFGFSRSADASRLIGISNVVSATMNKLMPSMPSVHRMPSAGIHWWFDTNW